MPAQLLKGKPLADKIKDDVKKDVAELKAKGVSPSLVAIQVGQNDASRVYTNAQKKNAEFCGIKYDLQELPADMTQEQLLKHIAGLNADPNVTGIIMQMPVPEQIDAKVCQWSIAYEKDVEGITPYNMGLVTFGTPRLVPCTAQGAFELIKSTGVDVYGKEVVVIGHSDIVGKPAALLLLNSFGTVTIGHVATGQRGMTEQHVRRAEILVVAVGVPHMIKGDWIKEGAIVVDIGITPKDGKIYGDVETEVAMEKAAWVTPVPGGAGTATTAILMRNTVEAAKWQLEMKK
ncbi:MAG: bifunctional 5,10-methylenetetrahydrofolate dehydrogenase/5,10-methenyltetrahydrofolate cyclohydrolase [Syntrophaceticus sp.]|jgi:methylenetetrahydrofolate dehydrogenase (NADP+)/methenyltetrahydrofolate cyclohydrolase|nr:bifunctional 5,10-methylenetetrahydrofolate dehydrogenase/5,10-methenyltetrahydrofolate cyclohydrolase [Syntrophaceticus sp.]MDD3315296.1 bifunctional 5,10-methylenetetrahydrofolate dehydrogenase/5,10-methenyltetrahydrofolate cyclohydrolase [Syntrophaceticus sp.]MDD4359723.1 bifunctional 5,10-methylenetetrahydrofolate dehydrogenase/5,10-methenyltetrahydrofolate cyclohydrolase [Syntrophaceticus sp.]MDD4782947.1 bifunctional 5,10-methylenetetrahydrofolate dehydrogenase/5,10-methenyltetrahydrofo